MITVHTLLNEIAACALDKERRSAHYTAVETTLLQKGTKKQLDAAMKQAREFGLVKRQGGMIVIVG